LWNKRNDEGPAPRTSQPEPVRSAGHSSQTASQMVSQTAPQPAIPMAAASREQPAPAPPPRMAAQTAAIGSSMFIKGDIRTQEELLVDGEVEGSLESHSLLTVGPNGKVRANIKAREVIIFGRVQGNVDVTEKLAIREQGSLVGDIKTAGISIDDGAYFKGSIDIIRPDPKVTAKPVKSEARVVEAPASAAR
jgi:cytoskeletal protein CcmA (bactofilin family)